MSSSTHEVVSPSGSASARAVLGIPAFKRLWMAQVVSDYGDALALFALLFFVQRATGSPTWVAWILVVASLPTVVLGLWAGVLVDRTDPRRVMIASDLVRAILAVLLIGFTTTGSLLGLLIVIGLMATADAFFAPARTSLLPRIVEPEALYAANAIMSTSSVVASLLGTVSAGVLVGVLDGFALAYAVDAASFLISAAYLVRVIPATSRPTPVHAHHPLLHDLKEGLRCMWDTRALRATLVAAATAMAGLGGVNALLVPFVIGDLGLPETLFGALEACQTVAMVIAGTWATAHARAIRPATLVPAALTALGLLVLLIAWVRSPWQLGAVLFGAGLVVVPMQAAFTAIVQSVTPGPLLGRTGAALNASVSGANLFAMAVAGSIAALVPTRVVFGVGGGIVVLAGLIAAFLLVPLDLSAPQGSGREQGHAI